jgi:hypothetical protein
MDTSTSEVLVRYLGSRAVANDMAPEVGPWPGMSHRARVIARALGLIAISAWLAPTDARLLLGLSLAVPIWIGAELAMLQRRRARRAIPSGSLSLTRPSGVRFSDPGGAPTPKAA